MEFLKKRAFLKEVDGDGRYIAIDSITMFSYHIEEASKVYFDGCIFAHCGVEKICVSRDDESSYEALEERLVHQIEEYIEALYFDELIDAISEVKKKITHNGI